MFGAVTFLCLQCDLSAFLVNTKISRIYLNTLDRWILLIRMEVGERGYIGSALQLFTEQTVSICSLFYHKAKDQSAANFNT